MADVLGLTVRDAVYLRLLTKYSVTRDEVSKDLDTFQMMLEDSFGSVVAKVLSRAIARRLYSELHFTFVENQTFGLPEYVQEAKSKLLKTNSRTAEKAGFGISKCKDKCSGDENCN